MDQPHLRDKQVMKARLTKETFLSALHEQAGICGHCGKRDCAGRKDYSRLPDKIALNDILRALKQLAA
jgi:hypothetical protein